MTMTTVTSLTDRCDRVFEIQLQAATHQGTVRTSIQTIKVSYSSLSQTISAIGRRGAKVIGVKLLTTTNTEAAFITELKPITKVEAVIEPAPTIIDVEPVIEPEPIADVENVIELEAIIEPEPVAEVETVTEVKPVIEPASIAEAETAIAAEPIIDPEPVVEAKIQPTATKEVANNTKQTSRRQQSKSKKR